MNSYILLAFVVSGIAVALPRSKRQAYYLPDGAELIVGGIKSTFQCEGRRYGYYADIDNGCKIFHVCHSTKDEEGREETQQYSFFCGNQTVFDQGRLVCSHPEEAIKCSESESFYYLNERLGIEDSPLLTDEDIARINLARA